MGNWILLFIFASEMKIVVDDKIPYIRETLEMLADEVVYLKGSDIGPEDVKDADALIVRTRTHCDEQLLKGSKVQFVATATIGYDHLDTAWLEQNHIAWTNCPGCNAGSVAQYIESVLLTLIENGELRIENYDNQTSAVNQGVQSNHNSQFSTLNSKFDFVSLETIEQEADIITFHVPLDETTHYLADKSFFQRLKKKPVIINSSRGGVVDEQALLQALEDGTVSQAVIDTWEGEPDISRTLLNKTFIGTPHIAGYSADGKVNADNMVIEALCRHFSLALPPKIEPPKLHEGFSYTGNPLELYNAMNDSRKLKTRPESFEDLRGNYPLRREKFN